MADRQPLLHDLAVTLRAPTVCLAGSDGQIRPVGVQGVFCGDLRVLDRAVVTVAGVEPEPIAHGRDGADAEHAVGLLRELGDPGADPTVWLRRDRRVHPDGLAERLTLVNRSATDLTVELTMTVGADLAPIETVKQGARGLLVAPTVHTDPAGVRLSWVAPQVAVSLDAPGAWAGGDPDATVLTWSLAAAARTETAVDWRLAVRDDAAVVAPATHRLTRPTRVRADDPRLAALLTSALDDLDALLLTEPDHPDDVFAAAGAPWFLTLFGRDSLWTATLLLPLDLRPAAGTLRTLARAQGRRHDPATGEQPGKILHELRRAGADHGGMQLPPVYYGTIDATPLWICLLRDAWRAGLAPATVRSLLPALDAALGWLRTSADRDGDGFAEYFDESGRGLTNQGWKDSGDAIRDAAGTIADGPVALAEVQGYLHEAAMAGADLLTAFGTGDPGPWRDWAAALAARFRERFWVADGDGRYPALALDGDKKPVDALSSNIGHLLGTGLLDEPESAEVGRRLLAADMASGYGLRTMSRTAGGYSPLSYHCGSVWPHDTAIVIRGLARSGQVERAAALGTQLLTAADGFDRRLPELLSGHGRDDVGSPVPYPASCRPQAWAAGAAVAVLSALLGLTVDVPAGVITLRPPRPGPVGALEVHGLPVGSGRLDVRVDAAGVVTAVDAPPGFRVVTG